MKLPPKLINDLKKEYSRIEEKIQSHTETEEDKNQFQILTMLLSDLRILEEKEKICLI